MSSAFRIFLRLCAVTCRADGGSSCGEAAGCSASVFGAPPSLRTPRPAQRPLTPDPALPESGGIRRPACPGKIWRPPRALIYGKRACMDDSDRVGVHPASALHAHVGFICCYCTFCCIMLRVADARPRIGRRAPGLAQAAFGPYSLGVGYCL